MSLKDPIGAEGLSIDRWRARVARRRGGRGGATVGAKRAAAHRGLGRGYCGGESCDRARRTGRRRHRAYAFGGALARSRLDARNRRHAHDADRSARARRPRAAGGRRLHRNLARAERAAAGAAGAAGGRGCQAAHHMAGASHRRKNPGFEGDIEIWGAGRGATLAANLAALRARAKGRPGRAVRVAFVRARTRSRRLSRPRGSASRFGRRRVSARSKSR